MFFASTLTQEIWHLFWDSLNLWGTLYWLSTAWKVKKSIYIVCTVQTPLRLITRFLKYYLGKVYLLQGNKLNEKGTDKVHIFWEGHKILRNLPLTFDRMYCSQKLWEDFAKFLWPSQNIWTLLFIHKIIFYREKKWWKSCLHGNWTRASWVTCQASNHYTNWLVVKKYNIS